jgi:hypothetical protein
MAADGMGGHFVLTFLFFIGRSHDEQADRRLGSEQAAERSRLQALRGPIVPRNILTGAVTAALR